MLFQLVNPLLQHPYYSIALHTYNFDGRCRFLARTATGQEWSQEEILDSCEPRLLIVGRSHPWDRQALQVCQNKILGGDGQIDDGLQGRKPAFLRGGYRA